MKVKHVLGLSGGKDSAALAIYMREKYPEIDIDYFFTDTGKELPEVYDFLAKLEGVLGKQITYLYQDDKRDFDHYLGLYNYFLPSPQQRWCTIMMKLKPFEKWAKAFVKDGYKVVQYVAIRSDEEFRTGYTPKGTGIETKLPFREDGIDKQRVLDILEKSSVGYPEYYEWRSRSGCTFCFFQQKIEWVNLKERHPEKYEEAKFYERQAIEGKAPFTWSQGETLDDLEHPDRVAQIKADFEKRKARAESARQENPLRQGLLIDLDELYLDDEGNGACLICHK